MEKELRNKFVLVTMTLMCLVFGIFFIVNHFRQQYWFNLETYQFVRWITQSGVLLNDASDSGKELIENNDEYNAIIAVIVSDNGDVLEKDYIAGTGKHTLSDRILQTVIAKGETVWKVGSYIYDIRQLPDSERLIVMVDTRDGSNTPLRILSSFLLILAGAAVLLLITVYLSRFVTKPAKAAMEREKQFISDASHELKTPLGAISINAQALRATHADNKHIRNIISESSRMSRLIERLLTLSRIDENADVPKTVFSLSSCAEEMALTYESVAYDKKIGYTYDVQDTISFYGNEDDFRQLTAILIDNAIKHTNAGNQIHISLTEQSGVIKLIVENTGSTIPQEDLPHIFERFYQSSHSRSGNSFGLGLAIAKAVTERNNGSITVTSSAEKTCFTVCFK